MHVLLIVDVYVVLAGLSLLHFLKHVAGLCSEGRVIAFVLLLQTEHQTVKEYETLLECVKTITISKVTIVSILAVPLLNLKVLINNIGC